jgi:hypothetical protein
VINRFKESKLRKILEQQLSDKVPLSSAFIFFCAAFWDMHQRENS